MDETVNRAIPDDVVKKIIELETNNEKYKDEKDFVIPMNDVEPDDDDMAFIQDEVDPVTLEKYRNELKNADTENEEKLEKTTTDVMSGVTASSEVNEEDENVFLSYDIKGKTITNSGKELIRDLIKDEPTEDELKAISQYFESFPKDEDLNQRRFDPDELSKVFSQRIILAVKNICTDANDFAIVLDRFIKQIWSSYHYITTYNDHMIELTDMINNINKDVSTNDNIVDLPEDIADDADKATDDLISIQQKFDEFTNKMKSLDKRNMVLKQDYTINDIDTRTVDEIKQCLDDALSFKYMYNKLNNSCERMKKEIRSRKTIDKEIEDWISDIRDDPNTVYTLPTNDFATPEQSKDNIVNYFIGALAYKYYITNLRVEGEDDPVDLYDYIKKHTNPFTYNALINKWSNMSYLLLYVITRTFKYRDLEDVKMKRILSYTLDMISKISNPKYYDTIANFMEYAYSKVYNK